MVDRLASSGSGDPLASSLFWNLLDQLPAAQYPNLRLVLQTNGLLLTPPTWTRLGEYARRIDEILVSVDACGPETYQLNRGGNWQHLMENLGGIRDRDVPLQLNFVVQANNYREMPSFVKLANTLRAHRIYFSALDNWGSYDTGDFLPRAVHNPGHPEHEPLLEILRDPLIRNDDRITLTRLPRPSP
jgi:MoaA/NifB/PqqE/SkfB family radical SAM enzyme